MTILDILFPTPRVHKGTRGLLDLIKHKYIRREGSPGNYRYYYPGDDKPKKVKSKLSDSKQAALKAKLGDTINGKSFEEQLEITEAAISQHEPGLKSLMDTLLDMAGGGEPTVSEPYPGVTELNTGSVRVSGRTKAVESAMAKLTRKPDLYPTADQLTDCTGARVTVGSIDEVKANVQKVKDRYEVVREEDYISSPKGDYRSHHLIIRDDDGLLKEVQIRTENQDSWANWFHDIYKPRNAEQKQWVTQYGDTLNSYASEMSEYFFAVDQGEQIAKPDCPEPVQVTFGCL